jgi:L-lactate dehydrogenase (cytochrome)
MAAAGGAGVTRALEILREDVDRTLRLLGCQSISQLDSSFVEFPESWLRKSPR